MKLMRGLAALLVLLALLAGAPVLLLVVIGNPVPPGGWAEAQLVSNRTIYGAVAVIGWIAWAQMAACIIYETLAAIRHQTGSRVIFATPGQQLLIRNLVFWVAAIGIGTSSVTTAATAVAAPTPESQAVQPHAAATLEAEDAATDAAQVTTEEPTTLWKMAETHLGDGTRWQGILDTNRGVKLPGGAKLQHGTQTIPANTTLQLPTGATPSTTTPAPNTETVAQGDTIWKFAEEAYGDGSRYPEIVEASRGTIQPDGRQLTDPDLIHPGWILTIPAEGKAAPPAQPDNQPAEETEPTPTPTPTPTPAPGPHADAPVEDEDPADAQPPATDLSQVTPDQTSVGDETAEADEESALDSSWVLAGLTGGGVLLAGALFIGLQSRRRNRTRHRPPGRAMAAPAPELAPTEMTITAVGRPNAELVAYIREALLRLAESCRAAGTQLPPVAAVELTGEALTLHLSGPTDELPGPWEPAPDQLHWSCPTGLADDDLGPEVRYVHDPYPLLVTVGESDAGERWLLNLEELATLTIAGNPEAARNLARHLAAQVAVNPWSQDVLVDCIGLAQEAEKLSDYVSYHPDNPAAAAATNEVHRHAAQTIERATRSDTDIPTARAGEVDHDSWPARILIADAGDEPEHLAELIDIVSGNGGKTATAVVVAGETTTATSAVLELTDHGRVRLDAVGLDLVAVGLTPDEAQGCALIYEQANDLTDVPVPVDETATDGWEAHVDVTGGLRREQTVPRSTPDSDILEPTNSVLPAENNDYVGAAAVVEEDLNRLAPKVTDSVRYQVEEDDPTLDADVAEWFSSDCARPRLALLGPITARTHGKALTERKAYFTELLAYLVLNRRSGVTVDQVCDAFPRRKKGSGLIPLTEESARNYVGRVRNWLGTDPRTGAEYLPDAGQSPAAQQTGTNLYQVSEALLLDWDLFRRLRARGEARGEDGQPDLMMALKLVAGRPIDGLRKDGGAWLTQGSGQRYDEYMAIAVADLALVVTTYHLEQGDTARAREAAVIARDAAPYEDSTRLSLARVTQAEGKLSEAERQVLDDVCNRSDDDGPPADLPERSSTVIDNAGFLAS